MSLKKAVALINRARLGQFSSYRAATKTALKLTDAPTRCTKRHVNRVSTFRDINT